VTISIIGNSHVVALKWAADETSRDFTYFWSSGLNLRDVTVQDGKLIGGTERLRGLLAKRSAKLGEKSRKEVELKASSAFVVIGLGLSPGQLARSYANVRLYNHMSRGMTMVSVDCLEEILVERLRSTTAFRIARLLRANSDRPVFLVPQPALFETAKTAVFSEPQEQRTMQLWRPLLDTSVGEVLVPIWQRALAKAAHCESAIGIAQPAMTLTGTFTKAEYQLKPGDYRHGNKSYGEHVLGRLQREFETVGL
jgi:hypothetical protein